MGGDLVRLSSCRAAPPLACLCLTLRQCLPGKTRCGKVLFHGKAKQKVWGMQDLCRRSAIQSDSFRDSQSQYHLDTPLLFP